MTVGNTPHPDKLESFSNAPGYRDVRINILDHEGREHQINLSPNDALSLWRDIGQVLRMAWSMPCGPIDKQTGETRPRDLNEVY